jgi:hypothetical protein
MMWAILDLNNKVIDIIEQDERPDNGAKITEGSKCAIGRIYNGWTYDAPKYTSYEFLLRLTAQERAAIRISAKTDDIVADFLQLSQAAQEIICDDPETILGMDYLVSIGIFSEQRKNEILS